MIRVYNQFNDYITHRRKEAKSKIVYAEFEIVRRNESITKRKFK